MTATIATRKQGEWNGGHMIRIGFKLRAASDSSHEDPATIVVSGQHDAKTIAEAAGVPISFVEVVHVDKPDDPQLPKWFVSTSWWLPSPPSTAPEPAL